MTLLTFNKTLALFPLADACAGFGVSAQAQGIANFQGEVVSASCNMAIIGGNNVVLSSLLETNLPTVGSTAIGGTFTMSVSACGSTPGAAKAYFYNTNAAFVDNGRLVPTGTGSGWQYQLQPATGAAVLQVGTTSTVVPDANDPGQTLTGGAANIQYRVNYYRSGAITAGTDSAQANYVLYFQ